MNTNEIDWETEAHDAMTREYDWITKTIRAYWHEAFDANKIYDPKVVELHDLAWDLHLELLGFDGKFAADFFGTMEKLKGVCGDLRREIRGEQVPAHIQRLLEEERAGFGLSY